jgi:hypothetical protein
VFENGSILTLIDYRSGSEMIYLAILVLLH